MMCQRLTRRFRPHMNECNSEPSSTVLSNRLSICQRLRSWKRSVPVDQPGDQACRDSVASGDATTCPSFSCDDEDDQARRFSEAARQGDRAALTQVLLSTALTFIDEKIADSPVSVPMTQARLVDLVRSIPDCLTQGAEEHLVDVLGPLIQEIFAEVVTAILEIVR